jgi:hypothetical protein
MWRLDRRSNRLSLFGRRQNRKSVASPAHIDIPTAITPTVISAIQVSSLLFRANQSASDEDAARLSLVLSPCMTDLLPLSKQLALPDQQIGSASAAHRRGLQSLRPSFWSR